MRKRVGTVMAVVMMTLGAAAGAEALPITINFSGVVGSVSAGLTGALAVGDALSGSYTFESTTAPRAGATVNGAVYDAVTDLVFTIGSYSAATAGAAPNGEIQIDNDPDAPFVDRYAVVSRATDGLAGAPINGHDLVFFGFRLDDSSNTAFSTALTLPASIDLSDFTSSAFFAFFGDEIVDGTITSIEVAPSSSVPEPTTVGLISLGFAVLARRRLRRAVS
jgi:hypothetical protein